MESDLPPATPPPPPLPRPSAPPLVFPPNPPRPPRSGRGWKTAAIVFLVLFCFSALGNLRALVGGLLGHGRAMKTRETSFEESVVLDAEADTEDKIVVIDVTGIITGQSERGGLPLPESIEAQLKAAAKDHNVRAVIVRIDSPGGEVLASDEIYNLITDFELKNKDKPVLASMGGLAASGGYYVAAPCQYIVANELTITGSIGVIMHGYNYRRLMDKVGVAPETFKSGRFKDMLSGEKEPGEMDPEEKKMVQTMIDETFAKFKKIVAEGRQAANKREGKKGRALAAGWQEFADGRILTARQAYDLGLVDQIGDFKTSVKTAKELAGVSDASLIKYVQPFDLGNLFRFLGKTETPALKIDLGFDTPKLQAGRPYYLLPLASH